MLKVLKAKDIVKCRARNTNQVFVSGKQPMIMAIETAEYLIIGVVPKRNTSLLVKSRGIIAPAPPKPMIEPQTSLLTFRLVMNSGILGIQEREETP
jgi:hypothetical protein